jgi:hypothetical protein
MEAADGGPGSEALGVGGGDLDFGGIAHEFAEGFEVVGRKGEGLLAVEDGVVAEPEPKGSVP